MTLEGLERGKRALIVAVDWGRLPAEDGARLRALGLDAGAKVAIAHRGVMWGRDPLAVTIGRMTVAVRRVHAAAMEIEPL
ncbi:FeoA family protein [Tsuneonella sp. SYSU-LHT278]|uniref:FeoA family protein n=1 Tax=Tsuneonella sediminis TaxID=3416089 RepID=UPI003F7B1F58